MRKFLGLSMMLLLTTGTAMSTIACGTYNAKVGNYYNSQVTGFDAADVITALAGDSTRSDLFVGTKSHGLYDVQNESTSAEVFKNNSQYTFLSVFKLAENTNNDLWISAQVENPQKQKTTSLLVKPANNNNLVPVSITDPASKKSLTDFKINFIASDNTNYIFFETTINNNDYFYQSLYVNGKFTNLNIPFTTSGKYDIKQLSYDYANHAIWLATDSGLLVSYRSAQGYSPFAKVEVTASGYNSHLTCVYDDTIQKRIVIGTASGGAFYFNTPLQYTESVQGFHLFQDAKEPGFQYEGILSIQPFYKGQTDQLKGFILISKENGTYLYTSDYTNPTFLSGVDSLYENSYAYTSIFNDNYLGTAGKLYKLPPSTYDWTPITEKIGRVLGVVALSTSTIYASTSEKQLVRIKD